MIRKIFISDTIKENIALCPPGNTEAIITSQVRREVDYFIFSNTVYETPAFLVLFISEAELEDFSREIIQKNIKYFYYQIVLVSLNTEFDPAPLFGKEHFQTFRSGCITDREYAFIVNNTFLHMENVYRNEIRKKAEIEELTDIRNDQNDLIEIGKALSVEKNQDRLLGLILFFSQKITGADAGSIFLVEDTDDGQKQLRFKYANTYSLDISYKEYVMPLNLDSIAGYVAITGRILNISDVYELTATDPVQFNSSFDKANNYRTKSMLVVPMRNYVDDIIGVIQLLNSKEFHDEEKDKLVSDVYKIRLKNREDFETHVIPFNKKYETLLEAITNQAAIAIENNQMIKQIRTQFEEFVKASVTAIESRDPATSGHSFRVAAICKELAAAINREDTGPYAALKFSDTELQELEYSALLHDFGKVYIDTAIFSKAKKLFPRDLEYLLLKLEYLYRCVELKYTEREAAIKDTVTPGWEEELSALQQEQQSALKRIREIKALIAGLNEPQVQNKNPAEIIRNLEQELKGYGCPDIEGREMAVLTEYEINNLSISRGSLNQEERKEIESHVERSYNFVSKIPWPAEFRRIPDFTQKHHEMLNGSGYPRHISSKEEIPVQARMIAIADIYDALTAADRPYKKALSIERTIAIMQEEAANNRIDRELLDIFLKYKIYDSIKFSS